MYKKWCDDDVMKWCDDNNEDEIGDNIIDDDNNYNLYCSTQ